MTPILRQLLLKQKPIIEDGFNRADNNTSMGNADTGQAWTAVTATWGIISNTAYTPTATANAISAIDTGLANGFAQVKIATLGYRARLIFRCSDATNRWQLDLTTDAKLRLMKVVAGTATTLATVADVPVSGDVVGVVVIGANIKAFLNGVQRINVDDAFNQTATLWGIGSHSDDTGTRFDDYKMEVV